MHNAESAQELLDAIRINYNYCREHTTLGKTPAEMAGINLGLNDNKIESLIRMSAVRKNSMEMTSG